jgi:SAM-dependent methyltransferase
MMSKDNWMSHCPVCQSESIETIYRKAHDYITGKKFQIIECNDCNIVYTSPQPKDLSPYYPKKYRKYNFAIQKILEFLYKRRAQRWSGRDASTGIVFEVGCGNGIMLQTLHKRGWKVFGNERTLEAAQFVHQSFNLPIFVGETDSLSPIPFVDMVILFQVLEHLHNPIRTLQQLNDLLKPNGKIIIAVPNFGGWQAKFGGERWFHLDVPRHLFHFSLPSLKVCLKKSGFEITNVNYISFEHDPYGWIQSTLNHLHKKHNLLTRFLTGMDKPGTALLIQGILASFIGLASLPISIASWLLGKGAIIEVTAKKSKEIIDKVT